MTREIASGTGEDSAADYFDIRTVMEGLSTIVYLTDANGRPEYYNRHWYEFTGLPAGEVTPQAWQSVVHPDDLPKLLELSRFGLATGEPWDCDFRLRHHTGGYFWHQIRTAPVRDKLRQITRRFGTILNIDHQKKMELALVETEHRFKSLSQSSPILIWMTNQHHEAVYYNHSWYEYTGQNKSDALTREWIKVIHPDDAEACSHEYIDAYQKKRPFQLEYRIRGASGNYRWFLGRGEPRFNSANEFIGYVGSCIDITERRETQEALARTEQRLELITAAAPLLLSYLDLDLTYQFANVTYEKWYGIPRHLVIGQHVRSIIGEANWAKISPTLMRARDGQKSQETAEIEFHDGRKRWLNVNYIPDIYVDRSGTHCVRGIVIVGVDVSSEKEAEEKIRHSRDQLETILKNVSEGIMVADRNGRTIFANDAAARLLSFEGAESLLEQPTRDFLARLKVFDEEGKRVTPDDLPLLSTLSTNRPADNIVFRVEDKNGTTRWMAVSAQPVLNEEGEAIYSTVAFRDITEPKRILDRNVFIAEATATLSASLDYKKALSELASIAVPRLADTVGIFTLGTSGDVEQIAVRSVGPNANELETYRNKVPVDLNAKAGVGYVLRSGQTQFLPEVTDAILPGLAGNNETLESARRFGVRSYLCVPIKLQDRVLGAISLIMNDSKRVFSNADIPLAEEIAGRAALTVENSRLYTSAQTVNRIKDEFLATLSHELRTPLNVIQGHAEILRLEGLANPNISRSVEAIYRNAVAQTQIINDLLDISAIITGKMSFSPELMDPLQPVQAALEGVRFTANAKSIMLTVELDQTPVVISTDPTRLQQVVWNLLSNAIKFTPQGGRISVRSHISDRHFCLEVEDTGIGIDSDFLPFVFERFRQEDSAITRRFGGLGLGLSIVRHLVEMHGGTVEASSKGRNQGTTFRINLPLAVDAHGNPLSLAAKVNEVPFVASARSQILQGKKVLVIEDQPDARELIEQILARAGMKVESVASAFEADELLRNFQPDIIVSDIGLPGEDGYSFIRRFRAKEIHTDEFTPAIALTAYARDEERKRALSAGYQSHLPKPVSTNLLLEAVARLVLP